MGADTEDRCPDCGGAKKASAATIRAVDRLRTDLTREREATAAAQAVVVRLASCIRALVSSCACPENDRPCADFMRHDRCVTVASLLAETPADALATYVAERLAEAQATIARLREKLDARAVERAYRGEKAGT